MSGSASHEQLAPEGTPTLTQLGHARRDERVHDAFARQLELTPDGGISQRFLERLHARARWAEDTLQWLREEQCPSCVYGSGQARPVQLDGSGCTSYGDATLVAGEPMCRWATRAAIEQREQSHTSERRERLLTAGCRDRHALRIVPPARRGQPPLPPVDNAPAAQRERLLAGPRLAVAAVERFLGNPDCLTLMLKGGVGVGKSIAAAHGVASEGRESCWIQASQWDSFARIREVGDRAEWADLLVVDELGTDHPANAAGCGSGALIELLCRRRNSGRRTLVTTNLTLGQLGDGRYDPRWLDRLDQDGAIVECGDRSLRAYMRGGV